MRIRLVGKAVVSDSLDLDVLREAITRVDLQIVELIVERSQLVKSALKAKLEAGLVTMLDREQESRVLRRAVNV